MDTLRLVHDATAGTWSIHVNGTPVEQYCDPDAALDAIQALRASYGSTIVRLIVCDDFVSYCLGGVAIDLGPAGKAGVDALGCSGPCTAEDFNDVDALVKLLKLPDVRRWRAQWT